MSLREAAAMLVLLGVAVFVLYMAASLGTAIIKGLGG